MQPPFGNIESNNMLIEVTGFCKLQCLYCYNSRFNKKKIIKDELSTKDIKRIILEAKELGYKNFIFSGGEPFLKEDFFSIIKDCEDCNVAIFTSASISEKEWIANIAEYPQIKKLRVSLDGLEINNSIRKGSDYKIIVENILKIKQYGKINIEINSMITSLNLLHLLEFYEFIKKIKPNRWNLDLPVFIGRACKIENLEIMNIDFDQLGEILTKLVKAYIKDLQPFRLSIRGIYDSSISYKKISFVEKRYGVPIAKILYPPNVHPCIYEQVTVIRPDGTITRCPSHNKILADIKEHLSLKEAIDTSNSDGFYKIKISQIKHCQNCRFINFCGAGCRANAKYLLGSDLKNDPIACNLVTIAEKFIWKLLPNDQKRVYNSLVNEEGRMPVHNKNLLECIEHKNPI